MNNEKHIIDALKRLLKEQGKTYKDVAGWLKLSEGTIKRLFSRGEIRLDRLIQVLNHLGRDMNDVVNVMNANAKHITQISVSQERELADDIPALLTAVAVLSHLSYREIIDYYGFEASVIEKALLKLDKMHIISLLPNNHYHLNVGANFRWLAGGPIQSYFMKNLATNYVSKPLAKDDELLMLGAMLSDESNDKLNALLDDFMRQFQELNLIDRPLPIDKKRSTFVVLAKRCDWYNGRDIEGQSAG